jgi:hypothetical protein
MRCPAASHTAPAASRSSRPRSTLAAISLAACSALGGGRYARGSVMAWYASAAARIRAVMASIWSRSPRW